MSCHAQVVAAFSGNEAARWQRAVDLVDRDVELAHSNCLPMSPLAARGAMLSSSGLSKPLGAEEEELGSGFACRFESDGLN